MYIMSYNRNEKRTRSDSMGEIEDGKQQELDERYYKVVVSYIKRLHKSHAISSKFYIDMLDNGTIDLIVRKKKKEGIEYIDRTHHEERICTNYIKMNHMITVSSWLDIFSTEERSNHQLQRISPPCHKICDYVALYISKFI